MKNLGNISPALGSHKDRKRLGRGPGSGQGKTAGKGHKGQKARKGGKVRTGFEGGQTPLYRRIPKHGFSNLRTKKVFNIISIEALNVFADGQTVTQKELLEKGLLKYADCPVKILANGELKKRLTLKVEKISASAKKMVEDLGGKTEEA